MPAAVVLVGACGGGDVDVVGVGVAAPAQASEEERPAVPLNLRVAAGEGSVSAAWRRPSGNGVEIQGYRVWFDTRGPVDVAATELQYSVDGLAPGSWHQVRVAAVGRAGAGPESFGETTLPAAPRASPAPPARTPRPGPAPAASSAPVPSSAVVAAPAPSEQAEPQRPQEPDSTFDQAWALAKAEDIIEDIETLDERMGDGIGADGGFRLLGDSYEQLADAGAPPGVDASEYLAHLAALADFAELAREEARYAPGAASTRYPLMRERTRWLLGVLGDATGADLRLR